MQTDTPKESLTAEWLYKTLDHHGAPLPPKDWPSLSSSQLHSYEATVRDILAIMPEANDWIRCADRMPTQKDGDAKGEVECTHEHMPGGTLYCHFGDVINAHNGAWRKIIRPSPPDAFETWLSSQGFKVTDSQKETYRSAFEAGRQSQNKKI